MKYLVVFFTLFAVLSCSDDNITVEDKPTNIQSHPSISNIDLETKYPINILHCLESNCTTASDWSVFGKVSNSIHMNAWFDIVELQENEGKKLWPLFNVFNKSDSEISANIGLRLYDENENILIEAIDQHSFKPTVSDKPGYENYLSMGSFPISEQAIQSAKYISIVFEPIKEHDK